MHATLVQRGRGEQSSCQLGQVLSKEGRTRFYDLEVKGGDGPGLQENSPSKGYFGEEE